MIRACFVALMFVLVPASARSEVVSASPNGFEIRHSVAIVIPQPATFDAFTRFSMVERRDTYAAIFELTVVTPGGAFARLCQRGGIDIFRRLTDPATAG